MSRHAYLIIAHNEFRVLNELVKLIDDERNDVYIHIDKKVDASLIPKINANKANLFFIPSIGVTWGGDNMIECELNLLKEATKTEHSYYHLLSGVDLPIKSQQYIHDFFQQNEGKNYFDVDWKMVSKKEHLQRVKYYRVLQNRIGRNSGKKVYLYEKLEGISIAVQRMLHIDRTKKANFEFYKGGQWFSITHELAKYIISQKEFIKSIVINQYVQMRDVFANCSNKF